ncbi:hypothetical protein M378DRAFT_159236 [Amanita muscaria Koide BX008]|uniref:Uncharacterized protein n=1 Tax=Amanita muscaria (strain Koide BX008) TaxID=946122 RepID=A0A0C2XGG2_AMAMK|nr:hypothetical protein M378DRAFT_159236 [Amanita muscaria Koide BX008]
MIILFVPIPAQPACNGHDLPWFVLGFVPPYCSCQSRVWILGEPVLCYVPYLLFPPLLSCVACSDLALGTLHPTQKSLYGIGSEPLALISAIRV